MSSNSGVTIQGAKAIVVGGGLAGLSAAHTILERGGRVLVLDKLEFLGGNSVKATSGINGAGTRVQASKNIPDSILTFEQDTARGGNGGKDMPATPLMKVLTHNSGSAVEWLIDNFGLDLSLVSRLGGHSFPRTHRGKERFPGMTITYALMEKFEELAGQIPDRAQVITQAKVTKLIQENGAVIGVEYERKGQTFKEYGPVILATGGYGADFGPDSIIAKYRPDLLHLPTTNGDHCTGDGLQMTMKIGGAAVDLKWVQVHPTGLVHPGEPNARLKFLAAEALRGVGGIMLDKDGKRFVNELGTRDYVTGVMWEKKNGPYRLVLNGKASKEIEWHCKHYVGRGLMKRYESGEQFAKDIGVDPSVLKQQFEEHNQAEKSKNDKYGKKFFANGPWSMNDIFHVAIITPVVHYCMGGVKIDPNSQIVTEKDNKPIKGLYAAGEVAGGVHGINRLGGSGLLGCVVFGRVAGASAAKELLSDLTNQSAGKAGRRLGAIAGQLINIAVDPAGKGVTIDVNFGGEGALAPVAAPVAAPAAASKPAAAPAAPAAPAKKEYTLADVAKHNTDKDCWVVVNGQVLDVTNFLNRHPGGKASIMLFAGKDATTEFNMLHKPDVVAKYAPDAVIGTLKK